MSEARVVLPRGPGRWLDYGYWSKKTAG